MNLLSTLCVMCFDASLLPRWRVGIKREGVGVVLNNTVSGGQEMKGNNVVIIIINTSYHCFIIPTFFENEYL